MLDFDSIAELIDWMAGPDIAVEAEGVSIEALTDDGRRVVVTIDRATASVTTRIYDMTRDLAA